MSLNEQLQILLSEAPNHGVPPIVMEKAVIPVLESFASKLQHLEYYVFQTRDHSWIITTLSHQDNPQLEKKVIYAFATPKDASNFHGIPDPEIRIVPIPVIDLLFQLFAVNQVDGLIFSEKSGNVDKGKEIERKGLENMIQQKLRSLKLSPPKSSKIPPNIA